MARRGRPAKRGPNYLNIVFLVVIVLVVASMVLSVLRHPNDRRELMRAADRLRAVRGIHQRYRTDRRTFERMVREVLHTLREPFRERIDNVAVVVAEWPDPDAEAGHDHDDETDLLGLYQGTPFGEREDGYSMVLPDRITIYRQPILAQCRSEAEVREEIRLTVLHEIGHYFGLSDDELP